MAVKSTLTPRARSGWGYLAARVLRLWRLYAWMDFMWATRSLRDCLTYSISDLVGNVSGVMAVLLLAERFHGIGGWSRFQVYFLLGYATLVVGLLDVLFGYNVLFISRRLGRGQLDHTLIQPQPLWLALLTEGFVPVQAWSTVTVAIGVMAYGRSGLHFELTVGWWGLLFANLLGSMTVLWAFAFSWGSLAFWHPRAAEEINSSTNRLLRELKSFPLDGLGVGLLAGLSTVAPAGYLGWYPCRALVGLNVHPWSWLITPAAGLVLGLLALFIFQKGLRHYERTGSQRYLSFGHRR